MRTRKITRPTLAELWRHLEITLEGLGVEDAPERARWLAVSGFSGRHARSMGVRVERSGEVVTVTSPEPPPARISGPGARGIRRRISLPKARVPAGR